MGRPRKNKLEFRTEEIKKKNGIFYEVSASNDGRNWQFFTSGTDKEYIDFLIKKAS